MKRLVLILKPAKPTIVTVYNKQFDAGMKPEKVSPFYIIFKRQRLLLGLISYRTLYGEGLEGLHECYYMQVGSF